MGKCMSKGKPKGATNAQEASPEPKSERLRSKMGKPVPIISVDHQDKEERLAASIGQIW
jgi:hypothetical protein